MADERDDIFKPKLGRVRSVGGGRAKSYLNRVLHQVSASGKAALGPASPSRRFTGARTGRGFQRLPSRFGPTYRRVVIKTRIVKLKGRGLDAARTHLRYIQRDGTSKEHEPGRLYDTSSDEADGGKLLERSEGDRHQFRFIVSAEDASELSDLKPFVRDLMAKMEEDLGTKLEWVAADHFNTEHPHTHIVLRGKDDTGKDLVIAPDYVANGMRRRASEIVTLELGPQTEHELRHKLERQVDQDRFTDIDRELVRDADDGLVDARPSYSGDGDRGRQALRIGRLRALEKRGLAHEQAPGQWRLADHLETTLRRAGERGDIVKTMHRGVKQAGIDAGDAEYAIYDAGDPRSPTIMGRIVDRGLHDELNDQPYVTVDANDGRVHYVALDPKQDMDDLPMGGIVAVRPAEIGMRPVDRTISEIARANGGHYAPDLHRAADRSASDDFVKAHVRRLEALRRQNVVQRFADGSFEIPRDFADRVARSGSRERATPRIATLSYLSLEAQVGSSGATWLDERLTRGTHPSIRGERFRKVVESAMEERRERLVADGTAMTDGTGQIRLQRRLLQQLRERELSAEGARIGSETGLDYVPLGDGDRAEGVYARAIRIGSGKFAVLEKSKEFTLVPWKDTLERQRGKHVAAIVRGTSVSFEFGRKRGLGLG